MSSAQVMGRAAAEMAAGLDRLEERATAALAVRAPEYIRGLVAAGEEPRAASNGILALLLAAMERRRAVAGAAASIRRIAAARCEAGVALDTLLEAIAVQGEVLRQALDEQIRLLAGAPAERTLLQAERRLDRAVQDVIAEVARGYMAAFAERSRRQQEEAASLVRVAAALNGAVEVADVAQAALSAVAEALPAAAAALWLRAEGSEEVLPAYSHGLRWNEDRALRSLPAAPDDLVRRALRSSAAVSGPPLVAGAALRLEAAVAVALRSRGTLVGVLVAGDRERRSFTPGQLRLLTSAGDQVAAALVRASQHRHEARTDALTGLANRMELERELERAIAASRRSGRALTLMLVDLDGLKGINDRRGHAAGDQALRTLASALHEAVRATDTCARIGGDEFAVLLPDTSTAAAGEVVRRVERTLAGSGLRFSAGLAGWEPGVDAGELVTLADNRLYRQKRRHHRLAEESGFGA